MNDLLLLALLLDGPKYGYQLNREAGWMVGQEPLHNNTVNPMLRRFLEEGWVTKKALPGERGQTRQQYALTAEGKRSLLERLSQFSETDASVEPTFHRRVGLCAEGRRTRNNPLGSREASSAPRSGFRSTPRKDGAGEIRRRSCPPHAQADRNGAGMGSAPALHDKSNLSQLRRTDL